MFPYHLVGAYFRFNHRSDLACRHDNASMTTIQEFRTPEDLLFELSKSFEDGDPSKDEKIRQKALKISSLLTTSLKTPRELAFETCLSVW